MTEIAVLGAGAFGTSLALALAGPKRRVRLWSHDPVHAAEMAELRENRRRLPGFTLPADVIVDADVDRATRCDILLLAVPMQSLSDFVQNNVARLAGKTLISCCKGLDINSGLGPVQTITRHCPTAVAAILSGPSFAVDIAAGLPTALTLGCEDDDLGSGLQAELSNAVIRFYRTTDLRGVELGGALKNVIAIATGIVAGAGLGDSARAALMTRGYAEMTRYAIAQGASARTLAGLAGLGDLVLTCSSTKSRNFAYGEHIGRGVAPEPGVTVEGVPTTRALTNHARTLNIDLPIAQNLNQILQGSLDVTTAVQELLSRPLKTE